MDGDPDPGSAIRDGKSLIRDQGITLPFYNPKKDIQAKGEAYSPL